MSIKLWKYNRATGYFNIVKVIEVEANAIQWLELFQADEPNEYFVLSKIKPRKVPDWQAYSRKLQERM